MDIEVNGPIDGRILSELDARIERSNAQRSTGGPITHLDGESGHETCRMSADTAAELSAGGRDAAPYVEAAIRRGDVVFVATPAAMRRMLKGYGAWDDLDTVDDDTIRERMAWIAAGDTGQPC